MPSNFNLFNHALLSPALVHATCETVKERGLFILLPSELEVDTRMRSTLWVRFYNSFCEND